MKPPKTRRYCPVCKQLRTFEYNINIFHSECSECGNRFVYGGYVSLCLMLKRKIALMDDGITKNKTEYRKICKQVTEMEQILNFKRFEQGRILTDEK